MKTLSRMVFNTVGVSFLLMLLQPPVVAQSSDDLQWGESVEGVQMSISTAGWAKPGVPKLRVVFRNTRTDDVDLYLGIIGGWSQRPCNVDGKSIPCTFNFALDLTDSKEQIRKLTFKGIMYVAGRLDPYLVWLRAGSTYTLEIGLDQFWSPDTHEYEFKPPLGTYRVSVEFEGRVPERGSHEQRSNKMNFWKGTLRSNTVEINR